MLLFQSKAIAVSVRCEHGRPNSLTNLQEVAHYADNNGNPFSDLAGAARELWCGVGDELNQATGGVSSCDRVPGTGSPAPFLPEVTCANLRRIDNQFDGAPIIPERSDTHSNYQFCQRRHVAPNLEWFLLSRLAGSSHDALACTLPSLKSFTRPTNEAERAAQARITQRAREVLGSDTYRQRLQELVGFKNMQEGLIQRSASRFCGSILPAAGLDPMAGPPAIDSCINNTTNELPEFERGRQNIEHLDQKIHTMLGALPFGNQPAVKDKIIEAVRRNASVEQAYNEGMAQLYEDTSAAKAELDTVVTSTRSNGVVSRRVDLNRNNNCNMYSNLLKSSEYNSMLQSAGLSTQMQQVLSCRAANYSSGQQLNRGLGLAAGLATAIVTGGSSLVGWGLSAGARSAFIAADLGLLAFDVPILLNQIDQSCYSGVQARSQAQPQCTPEESLNAVIYKASRFECAANVLIGGTIVGVVGGAAIASRITSARPIANVVDDVTPPVSIVRLADEVTVEVAPVQIVVTGERVGRGAARPTRVRRNRSDTDAAGQTATAGSSAGRRLSAEQVNSLAGDVRQLRSELDELLTRGRDPGYIDINRRVDLLIENPERYINTYISSARDRARVRQLHQQLSRKSEELAIARTEADLTRLADEATLVNKDCRSFNSMNSTPAFAIRARCTLITFTQDSSRYCSCGQRGRLGAWITPCPTDIVGYVTAHEFRNDKALPRASILQECKRVAIPAGTTVMHGGLGPAFSGYGGDAQMYIGITAGAHNAQANIERAVRAGALDVASTGARPVTVSAVSPLHDAPEMRSIYNLGRVCHRGGTARCTPEQIREIENNFNRFSASNPNAISEAQRSQYDEWLGWVKGCRTLDVQTGVIGPNTCR